MRRFLVLAMPMLGALAVAFGCLIWHVSRFDEIIEMAAARNGVDFYLAKAVIYEESWFRPGIRGAAGEFGLMQIMKPAAADFAAGKGLAPFSEDMLLEPRVNIEIGCWYLGQSLDRYKNSPAPMVYALLRYNAGEARTDAWLKLVLDRTAPASVSTEQSCLSLVDYPKTKDYVRRILQRMRSHNFIFPYF
jgi:soluble lytic murein transglycosylase